jgi:hypothetical protein
VLLGVASGCGERENAGRRAAGGGDSLEIGMSPRESVPAPPPPPKAEEPPAQSFHPFAVQSSRAWRAYASRLGPQRLAVVFKINRIDAGHVGRGDTLAIPDAFGDTTNVASGPVDEAQFSPFPLTMPVLDSIPKLFAVSRRVQAFGAYEHGRLVRWGPTSTGKKSTPTPDGLFHATWKARETISTENPEWILPWYVNFENRRGLSTHQYALPGYPASHACVRLLEADARWLYGWVDQWRVAPDGDTVLEEGTPFLLFDEYAFGQRRPWKRLLQEPAAASVSAAELEAALAPHLGTIRESLLAQAGVS